jgi:glucosamine-6-phosphate deaminase
MIGTESMAVQKFQVGTLKLEIHPSTKAAGVAAANAIAEHLRQLKTIQKDIAVIFATGASQLETLGFLTSMPDVPWNQIRGFHLDEYIGLDANHPASFRRYLRKNLTERVQMKEFFEIDGSAPDPEAVCREYAQRLRAADPQICLLGFGENGHLAFNDPGEADFNDPKDVKVVNLDHVCRQQQASEGWFKTLQDVPAQAITVTIPALFRVPKLILTVPGKRKAQIVRRVLEEPISPECPATILRTHPDAIVYLDTEAAAEWI